jgi:adenosylhomocysteine nucleosidase
MKIAILGAMDEEIALIKTTLNDPKQSKLNHLDVIEGKLGQHDIILLKCGIGKVASAVAATLIIQAYKPDALINTGSAGGFDPQLNVGDIVIGNELIHNDVDITHFGYALGQCAGMPETYPCAKPLVEAAKVAATQLSDQQIIEGMIATGDSFIGSDEEAQRLKQAFPKVAATEMEGAAIAQTCFLLDTDCLVIRSLSDIAGKTSSVSFEQYLQTAGKNSATLVMNLIHSL